MLTLNFAKSSQSNLKFYISEHFVAIICHWISVIGIISCIILQAQSSPSEQHLQLAAVVAIALHLEADSGSKSRIFTRSFILRIVKHEEGIYSSKKSFHILHIFPGIINAQALSMGHAMLFC